MDIDKLNKLREERRRKKDGSSFSPSASNNSPANESQTSPDNNSGINIQECKREFKDIEKRIQALIQAGQYDKASQELSHFYNSHKSQDTIGGIFYQTFGFWLDYWALYIAIAEYEDRILNNEHNTHSQSVKNNEKDIERSLIDIKKDWEEANIHSTEIENLYSRYQNAMNSKDEWTKENAYSDIKMLEDNISGLINQKNFDKASQLLLDFYHTAEKTYAHHQDILTGEITFYYLYWNTYLNIKILEYYSKPENYDKTQVAELEKQIDDNIRDLRLDKDYLKAYSSKISYLYSEFSKTKDLVKSINKGEKQPWTAGFGAAFIVFIIVLICKWIWGWGSWTLWVWPLVFFVFAFIGEMMDD